MEIPHADLERIIQMLRQVRVDSLSSKVLPHEMDRIEADLRILSIPDPPSADLPDPDELALDPRAKVAPHLLAGVMRHVSLDIEYRFRTALPFLIALLSDRPVLRTNLESAPAAASNCGMLLRQLAHDLAENPGQLTSAALERRFYTILSIES